VQIKGNVHYLIRLSLFHAVYSIDGVGEMLLCRFSEVFHHIHLHPVISLSFRFNLLAYISSHYIYLYDENKHIY
jgi:hypothetical protein